MPNDLIISEVDTSSGTITLTPDNTTYTWVVTSDSTWRTLNWDIGNLSYTSIINEVGGGYTVKLQTNEPKNLTKLEQEIQDIQTMGFKG